MEKEKPYRCDVCGKRYKNLNGLKYHRQHSTACNPDLAQRQSSTESGQVDALSSRTVSAGPSRTSPMPMPAPKYAPLGMGGFGNLDGMTTGPSHMAGTGMI